MKDKLQAMLDDWEIRRLLAEYCHGCDRLDAVHMASVYAEVSRDDHGHFKGDGKEFARYATQTMKETVNSCSHLLGQSLINVDGDRAAAETYFQATLRYSSADGVERLNQLGGRYVDTLERHEGNWRVKQRTCVRDWSISHTIKEDWLKDDPFVQGRPSGEDVSFAALGLKHSGSP
jgi:hypothetical protein